MSFFFSNSRTFHEHVTNLQRVIHPNHKAVRVPKVGHSLFRIMNKKACIAIDCYFLLVKFCGRKDCIGVM